MSLLENKVAVVTGGSRGLGLGIAREFAQEGARVVIASRSQKSVDDAVKLICDHGGRAAGISVDVGEMEQVKDLLQFTLDNFGQLDIWINNAGTSGPYGETLDYSPEIFSQVIRTNIIGTYNGSRVAMKHFVAQHSGKLINILGNGWRKPVPYQNAYASSKIWMRWFTQSLATESRDTGVGVFALNPGMVLTELLTDVEVYESARSRLDIFPMIVRVLAKPPEVPARKVAWLASSATDGKTGLVVNVFNPVASSFGFIREGINRIFKQPEPPTDVQIKVIPPSQE